ncbi:hypothetical protein Nm8I071_36760 [Nonomuraea sp. TT08I-71]|nr:hypothetical protein Nm8I071_36760 [Nonomuraea sp. TT08I-71]
MTDSERWSQQHSDDFEMARELLGSLIAASTARLSIVAADDEEAEFLRKEVQTYAAERRNLSVHDRGKINKILSDYPAKLKARQAESHGR